MSSASPAPAFGQKSSRTMLKEEIQRHHLSAWRLHMKNVKTRRVRLQSMRTRVFIRTWRRALHKWARWAAARGAEIGDADSARAARIELLQEENAKIMRTLEKVRGAISYWAELGFTADKDGASEEEGPAASAEPVGAPGRGRRLESKVPAGVKVWQGGVLHNFKNAATCLRAWSKLDSFACSGPAWRLRVAPHSQSWAGAH